MVNKKTKQTKEIEQEENIEEEEQVQQPAKALLVIKDVRGIMDSTMEAYFKISETEIVKRIPEFHGIMVKDNEEIPTVLVCGNDGLLLPPFMIGGFVGMYPIQQTTPEQPIEPPEQPEPAHQDDATTNKLREYAQSPDPEAQIDNII